MMKTLLFKTAILIFMTFPLVTVAKDHDDQEMKGKYTKEKTLKKEYNVNSDALVNIKNKYGNLNISTWNENRVVIEVHIKTNGNNEEKVQKRLDAISVDFEASSSTVSAKTIFNKSNWNIGRNNNVSMKINYTVKMPASNSVDLNNDYGAIILDKLDGNANIDCDYGRLEIEELRGKSNKLNFDYTSKSTIGYMSSGSINADYSGFRLEKAGNVQLSADYSHSNIGQMENLTYSCDYGSLTVGEANNIEGNGDYTGMKLGVVHGNLSVSADYGSLKIKEMADDAGNVMVDGDYTGVSIGYHPAYSFNFELRSSYGGIGGLDGCNITNKEVKNSKKYYKGACGKSKSGNNVQVTTQYGGVSFRKN